MATAVQSPVVEYNVTSGVAVLRLNAPPLNTITFELLEQLRAAIRRANDEPAVRGIVIAGNATHFSAGADLGIFRALGTREDAIRTSLIYQEAFQEVEDSGKPVVAAVAGKVSGAALELALACHWRVCTAETSFSFPEVRLGINPGAGGTQRLPRLIGPEAALQMLLTGNAVAARQALAMGLADTVCGDPSPYPLPQGERGTTPPPCPLPQEERGTLLQAARCLLESAGPPRRTSRLTEKIADGSLNAAAFARAEKLLTGVRPEIIAPRKIAAAVKTGLEESFQAGLQAEQTAFAECMDTQAARNKIYVFFATRDLSKAADLGWERRRPAGTSHGNAGAATADLDGGRRDAGAPSHGNAGGATISKAAVIGMGAMGTGIAQALAMAGVQVLVLDEQEPALQKGLAKIKASLEKRAGQDQRPPQWPAEVLGRITTTTRWQELAPAELVIEAVFEDLAVKRAVLARLAALTAPNTILASNTSTLSLDALAEGLPHGERLIGMHFFNPAQHMPLVEIIRREATAASVIATAMKFAKTIRKTPVLVKNREGFLVNRLFIPYLKEAFWLLEEGVAAADVDGAIVEFGFPMGPLLLIDMAGLDILAHSDRILSRAFPHHGGLPTVVARLVAQGQLGQKTGAGVYRYEAGKYAPLACEATAAILAEVRRERGLAPRRIEKDEIVERLVLRMVGEAFLVLEEGLVQRPADLDAATVLGIGFPDFRGGVLQYARDAGLECIAARLEKLAAQFGGRFSPCRMLRAL